MNHEKSKEYLIDLLARFTGYAGIHLPDDIMVKLAELRETENSQMAKIIYDAMFDDIQKADEMNRPCCQDTGIIQYFVQVGSRFPFIDDIEECLSKLFVKLQLTHL